METGMTLILTAAGKLLKCLFKMKACMNKADYLLLELEISAACYRSQVDAFQQSHGHRAIRLPINADLCTFSRLLDNASEICQKVSSKSTIALFLKSWYKYVPMLKDAAGLLDSMWQKCIKGYSSGKMDHIFEKLCASDDGIKAFPPLPVRPTPAKTATPVRENVAAALKRQQDAAVAAQRQQEQARHIKLMREAESALKQAMDTLEHEQAVAATLERTRKAETALKRLHEAEALKRQVSFAAMLSAIGEVLNDDKLDTLDSIDVETDVDATPQKTVPIVRAAVDVMSKTEREQYEDDVYYFQYMRDLAEVMSAAYLDKDGGGRASIAEVITYMRCNTKQKHLATAKVEDVTAADIKWGYDNGVDRFMRIVVAKTGWEKIYFTKVDGCFYASDRFQEQMRLQILIHMVYASDKRLSDKLLMDGHNLVDDLAQMLM